MGTICSTSSKPQSKKVIIDTLSSDEVGKVFIYAEGNGRDKERIRVSAGDLIQTHTNRLADDYTLDNKAMRNLKYG